MIHWHLLHEDLGETGRPIIEDRESTSFEMRGVK
jgi:hypothetical protein